MKHLASLAYWYHYRSLPEEVQALADKNFTMLKADPRHPSLRLKKIGEFWTVRVGLRYRAIATAQDESLVWIWIGSHEDYDALLKGR